MLNFENAKVEVTEKCNLAEPAKVEPAKVEPAKAILENMDAILKELVNKLDRIERAIFGNREPADPKKENPDNSMLETLSRQRNVVEACLRTAIHIREGLW